MSKYTSLFIIHFQLLLLLCSLQTYAANITGNVTDAINQQSLVQVSVFLEETGVLEETNKKGEFQFEDVTDGTYTLTFFLRGYTSIKKQVEIENQHDVIVNIALENLQLELAVVDVAAEPDITYNLHRLRNVEGLAIYAAKKSEVIEMSNLVGNLATNNARQVYKGIAGLNIWENDGAGLQLSIGARGLDPNRTSNFNTRQNGYDISADALGYPESYYTPPTQALQRIEIVRGAASLQYGPQFGGLLNFVFKKGNSEKPFEFVTENTVGSFGLFSTFNSIGGGNKKTDYYAFFQRKQGNGWRPNSDFHQNTAYINVNHEFSPKLKVGLQYTYMDYLAQQAGGLQDFEFEQDARQSKRARNWFQVNWNLAALTLDYRLSDNTKINSRTFYLNARREALGELGAINRPDPLRERDLIRGEYENFGNETRLIHRYQLGNQSSTFLVGGRYYQGFSKSQQGNASDGSDADFRFLNPNDLERSQYEFPSRNASLFIENLFNLKGGWSITPGARLEYIRTASDGFFKERVFSGGQVIFEQKFEDSKENSRSLALLGLGVGHKISDDIEAYGNFSQNYRSINFTDLAVVNPNLVVDSLLKDEKGYNADLGIRGQALKGAVQFDASVFLLRYQNRIGVGEITVPDVAVVEKSVAFRTNIGDARIVGLEAYVEADVLQLMDKKSNKWGLSVFTNFSALKGEYLSGQSAFVGNDVELIPPFSLKTGINLSYQNLKLSYQYAYTQQHFSDATNAEFVVDATRGLIPSYSIQDLSVSYTYHRYKLQSGINNLMDAQYFTRRAAAYPGPGIIPSDGRSFYLTIGARF
ncbi:MAG: TonB-dependent receptor domain-containing protein [Chitinophagales bacterium]